MCAGRMPEPSLELLVRRFPSHALAIRRLYIHDPEFRAVCGDCSEVQRALEYWQGSDEAAPERVAEYRRMLEELEDEALAMVTMRGST